jgi:hypothetical protein
VLTWLKISAPKAFGQIQDMASTVDVSGADLVVVAVFVA